MEYGVAGSTKPFYFDLDPVTDNTLPGNPLNINTARNNDISDPFNFAYTTVGDNLTNDFDIIPAEAGTLRIRFWQGTDDTGVLVFDESKSFTAAQVDTIQTFGVGNPYLFDGSTPLFVRFEGIQLKGGLASGTDLLPDGTNTIYFVSYVQGFERVNFADENDISGMAFAPVVTTIDANTTINAANYDTFFGEGNFAIIQMFNASGNYSAGYYGGGCARWCAIEG